MRDKSMTDDYKTTLRSRANADTQQALAGGGFRETSRADAAGERAAAIQGQLGQATTQAKGIENRMKTGVLGTARRQAAEATTGLARASRLGASEALTKAKAAQDVSAAKYKAGGQLLGATVMGANNKGMFGDGAFSEFLGNMGENIKAQGGI